MMKNYIQKKLENYVKAYFAKHPEVKLVVVAGSVGKTSTKVSIGTVLAQKYRIRLHSGNHNGGVSAPLAILGIEYPTNIRSIRQWLRVFRAAKKRIKAPTDVDVIVQELGIDKDDHMSDFARYLVPDIAVITAVTPEHMEYFGTIETVAQEELAAANFSRIAIINRDDIDGRFASYLTNPNIDTYGTTATAEYRFEADDFSLLDGYKGTVITPEIEEPIEVTIKLVGEHILRPAIAAAAVGAKLGMNADELRAGLAAIRAVPGRMNILRGVEESLIIDDTYNSSPAAASAALTTLYSIDTPQRIALFGDMNELGATSADEHKKLGEMCDPDLLAWVVTVGSETEAHLAPAARARGCQVKSFKTALEAGAFVHGLIEQHAVILAKGSQGGIYLEEAVKVFLHTTHEDHELVRQSPQWKETKDRFFSKFS